MADESVYRFRVDDSEVEKSMLRTAELVEQNDKAFKDLEQTATNTFSEISDSASKTEQELSGYAKQVDNAAKKTKEAEQETGRFGRGLKTLFGNLSVGGVSLNDLADGLQNVKGGLSDVAGSSGKAAQGFGVLRLGAIGLAIAVGTAVVAAFSKFQKNADSLRVGLAQAGAVLNTSIIAVGKWGNELIKAATGQKSLRDAIQDAKKATADFNVELRTQIALEGQIAKQQIGLERTAKEQAAFFALQKREIEALNLIADDTSKPFAQREAAAKKRFALSEQQGKAIETRLTKEIALTARIGSSQEQQAKTAKAIIELSRQGILTTENLANRIAKTRGAAVPVTTDDFKAAERIFGIINELGDAQESLLSLQTESKTQLQGISNERKQAAETEQKRIDDLIKSYQGLLDITAEARVKLSDDEDALANFNLSNATAAIEKMKIEYAALAKELKTGETKESIDALFQPLQDIADIDFLKADFVKSLEAVTDGLDRLLRVATNPLTGNIADIVTSQTAAPLKERLRAAGLDAGKALGAAIAQGNKLEAERQKEAANEQARQLVGQLAPDAVNAFFEAEQARFELQIAQQDALIAKIQERLQAEQSALAEQQKLADEGFANDIAGVKKRVEAQERLLRDSENKKIEIERRAAKQRAIIAAGQQAVELTLAVAKLISAEASKGLIGLVLALGGLAIISRITAAGRSQAASEAGRTAAFATGTEYVDGAGTGTSDSISARLSKGERVVTAKDNDILGGRALSNKELVRYALIGQRIHKDPLFAFAMGLRGRQSELEEGRLSLQVEAMREGFEQAALKAADKQIGYWKTRPIEYKDGDGNLVREWQDGNRVVRQIEVIQPTEI